MRLSPQFNGTSYPLIVAFGRKPASMKLIQWYFVWMRSACCEGMVTAADDSGDRHHQRCPSLA